MTTRGGRGRLYLAPYLSQLDDAADVMPQHEAAIPVTVRLDSAAQETLDALDELADIGV